ncbi:MAG: P1 family peptidase [bacterium]|nr:P1 family peptidase [bacterium]
MRARELGIHIGPHPSGLHDAITDVPGVRVGHATIHEGERFHTGVTVILPPGDNPFRHKHAAALAVQNGFGKLIGATQLQELGELESPIALTGTLNVHRVADGLLDWLLARPGNERVRSANVVVGETNDGRLSDIRARPAGAAHVRSAIAAASDAEFEVGAVGAGAGTMCFGYKGGIGTSSRRVDGATVGVLVQTNFGGRLRAPKLAAAVGNGAESKVGGTEAGTRAAGTRAAGARAAGIAGERVATAGPVGGRPDEHVEDHDGSCMIVIATDAPLDQRALQRLATRAFAGMARAGASFSHGSGDYAIAFSTTAFAADAPAVWRSGRLSPLFAAVADATEQAIYDSLAAATTTTGQGRTAPAAPLARLRQLAAAARGQAAGGGERRGQR